MKGHEQLNVFEAVPNVQVIEQFEKLDEYDRRSASRAYLVLQAAHEFGCFDMMGARRMLDFGAGTGGSTLALRAVAEASGGRVEAVEAHPRIAKVISDRQILPEDQVHAGNGITLLEQDDYRGGFDLITAFMLGPDMDGRLARRLLPAARQALAADGCLLMTSDTISLMAFRDACAEVGVACRYITSAETVDGCRPGAVAVHFDL